MKRYLHNIIHSIFPLWCDAPASSVPPAEPTKIEKLEEIMDQLEDRLHEYRITAMRVEADVISTEHELQSVMSYHKSLTTP